MNRFTRSIVSFTLSMFLLTTSVFATTSLEVGSATQQSSLDIISIEELGTRNDVKKFILESGFETPVVNAEIYDALNRGINNNSNSYSEKLRVADALGLNLSEQAMFGDSTQVIVESNSYSISNVWYLNYVPYDSGFSINVFNVGMDPLDSISGTVVLQKLNRDTWNDADRHVFNKTTVNSGNVTTWTINKDAVAENFEYDITVVEDGQRVSYNNKGEYNKFRYNFEVGTYTYLDTKGGERHHLVSSKALGSTGYNSNYAPCIRMIARDHRATPNWGSYTDSVTFRNSEIEMIRTRKFAELLRFEVDALRAIPDPGGNYSSLSEKYSDSIVQAALMYEQYFGFKL